MWYVVCGVWCMCLFGPGALLTLRARSSACLVPVLGFQCRACVCIVGGAEEAFRCTITIFALKGGRSRRIVVMQPLCVSVLCVCTLFAWVGGWALSGM